MSWNENESTLSSAITRSGLFEMELTGLQALHAQVNLFIILLVLSIAIYLKIDLKAIMLSQDSPIRMAEIKWSDSTKYWRGCRFSTMLVECKIYNHFRKPFGNFL